MKYYITAPSNDDPIELARYNEGVVVNIDDLYTQVYNPDNYGAVGDGINDDSTAFSRALDAWLAATVPGVFKLTPGKNYLINTAISKSITTQNIGPWSLEGYGAKITSGLSSGTVLTISVDANVDVRNLMIRGLYMYGTATESLLELDGGDSATGFFYKNVIRDCVFENFGGNGLSILGDFFESTIDCCTFFSAAANTTGYGLYCYNGTGSGIVSSLNVHNCVSNYAKNGFFVKTPTADVKFTHCTALLAQEYGILLENNFGNAVINCHLENNWESAASLDAGQAGLFITNSGSIIGCYGTTNSKQKYVVRVYAVADKMFYINGGTYTGSVVKYAYVDGAAGGYVEINNSHPYDANGDAPACTIARKGFGYKLHEPVSTSGTGEDDLMSYTLPDDVFGVQGAMRVTAFGIKQDGGAANNKTIKFKFGSTSVTFHAAANNTNDWKFEATICNYRDDTQQFISWVGYDGTTMLQGYDSASEDTTGGDITVKFTGECADAGDVITQYAMIVEYL